MLVSGESSRWASLVKQLAGEFSSNIVGQREPAEQAQPAPPVPPGCCRRPNAFAGSEETLRLGLSRSALSWAVRVFSLPTAV